MATPTRHEVEMFMRITGASEQQAVRKLEETQRTFPSKKSVLPEEPPLDGENTINLVVRMPDGSRHGRRFLKSGKLQVIPYPRRALELANGSQSLSELGLNSKQEALYLELI